MDDAESGGPLTDSDDDNAPGFGTDETPLGDTSQHAGDVSDEGHLESDPEDPDESADPKDSGDEESGPPVDPDAAAHMARPGEGEGAQRLEFEGRQPPPASERLADREA